MEEEQPWDDLALSLDADLAEDMEKKAKEQLDDFDMSELDSPSPTEELMDSINQEANEIPTENVAIAKRKRGPYNKNNTKLVKRAKIVGERGYLHQKKNPLKHLMVPSMNNLAMNPPMSPNSLSKRPRGRPPLGVPIRLSPKMPLKHLAVGIGGVTKYSSEYGAGSSSSGSAGNIRTACGVGKTSKSSKQSAGQSSNDKTNSSAGTTNSKVVRPPISFVTKQIMSRMMIVDYTSSTELSKCILDTTKDTIQSILEVLHVLGYVQTMKIAVATKDYPLNSLVYTLPNLAKGYYSPDITKIEEEVLIKLQSHQLHNNRIFQLQVLQQ